MPYEFTAESKSLTTVIKIQRSFFLDMLKRFPKDYVTFYLTFTLINVSSINSKESFAMIRDELIFNDADKYLKCQPCSRYDHSLYKCPRIHYLKRKNQTICQHLHSEPQKRLYIQRRRFQKYNSLDENYKNIKQKLKQVRINTVYDLQHKVAFDNNPYYFTHDKVQTDFVVKQKSAKEGE